MSVGDAFILLVGGQIFGSDDVGIHLRFTTTAADLFQERSKHTDLIMTDAAAPKRRTFKKFQYKGVDLDKILDMKRDEFEQKNKNYFMKK